MNCCMTNLRTQRRNLARALLALRGAIAFGMLVAVALPACASGQAPSAKSTMSVVPQDGVIKVFDGKSLAGFDTWLQDSKLEDPRRVFQIVDGVLRVSGDGMGAVITEQSFENYYMVLEYRWGERIWREREDRARDSGLLIHSNGAQGGYQGIWMPSLEVQIIEGGVGDFIRVAGPDQHGQAIPMAMACEIEPLNEDEVQWKQGAARVVYDDAKCPRINWFGRDPNWQDVRGFRGTQDPDSARGDWTRLDVICDHVQTYVNGVLVNEAFDVAPHSGSFSSNQSLPRSSCEDGSYGLLATLPNRSQQRTTSFPRMRRAFLMGQDFKSKETQP
jgi:hypothetical protein